jgi:hypothetical protein
MHRIHREQFNLKNSNEAEGKEKYRVEISTRVNCASETETVSKLQPKRV